MNTQTIKRLLDRFSFYIMKKGYDGQYKKIIRLNNIKDSLVKEDLWLAKWSQFGSSISPYQYRVFSHYIGEDVNIVPEDVCHHFIEPALNPYRFVGYYADKNVFDKLFPKGYFPETILRRMGGVIYDGNYKQIDIDEEALLDALKLIECKKIIVKPSVDGMSGRGVQMYELKDGVWVNSSTNIPLSLIAINNEYGSDYIIQEAVEQSDYISQFNKTSVNTLRLSLYRSVVDNQCHVTGAIMRIGGKGSVVDNAHAGGVFVGINQDGTFCKEVYNQYGQKYTKFNDIDFADDYRYPNWNNVLSFAKSVAQYVPHHRLIALDIVLDKDDNPHLIEFNIEAYSSWLFQYTTGSAFGKFTDEIIEYSLKHQPRKVFKLIMNH